MPEPKELLITKGQKCTKHNMIVHSFFTSNNQLLCDKCISEIKEANNESMKPIPSVFLIRLQEI